MAVQFVSDEIVDRGLVSKEAGSSVRFLAGTEKYIGSLPDIHGSSVRALYRVKGVFLIEEEMSHRRGEWSLREIHEISAATPLIWRKFIFDKENDPQVWIPVE